MNLKVLSGNEYAVSLEQYGFKLHERYPNSIYFTYDLQVAGRSYSICDRTYLRLSSPNKTIFVGTHHHGAYYFLVKAYAEKLISGTEQVLHIDQSIHPDNRPLETDRFPGINAGLIEHVKFMNSLDRYNEKLVITVANYVTAVNNIFPEASLYYLHDGVHYPSNWFGAQFSLTSPVLGYTLNDDQDTVVSNDLDIFVQTNIFNSRKYLSKLIEIAQKAKFVMFFTSPGYIYQDKVTKYLNEILTALVP